MKTLINLFKSAASLLNKVLGGVVSSNHAKRNHTKQNLIRVSVVSSNIAEVAYSSLRCSMVIKFNSGVDYEYDAVPQQVFEEMIGADSVGKYFHANVRGVFNYKRLN